MFESRVRGKIFTFKRQNITADCKSCIMMSCIIVFSPITGVSNQGQLNAACMGHMKNAYTCG